MPPPSRSCPGALPGGHTDGKCRGLWPHRDTADRLSGGGDIYAPVRRSSDVRIDADPEYDRLRWNGPTPKFVLYFGLVRAQMLMKNI